MTFICKPFIINIIVLFITIYLVNLNENHGGFEIWQSVEDFRVVCLVI